MSALEQGAAFAIGDDNSLPDDPRIFKVSDALITLQELAKCYRQIFQIPILGITGSNGKTTTRELIKHVLATTYKVHGTQGNLNNHIGLPLTLLNMPQDTQVAVLEMGANKVGDNQELCNIFLPNWGIITNLGKEHLEGFGNMEGVIQGNSELYHHLIKHHGIPLIHIHDPILMNMAKRFDKIYTYGLDSPQADFSADIVQLNPYIILKFNGFTIKSPLFGRYNAENIMAALAFGCTQNIRIHNLSEGIESYSPENQRSQIIQTQNNWLIADCYNANPSSMEKAITNFLDMPGLDKILMLGAMFELGEAEMEEHKKLAEWVSRLINVKTFLCGKAFQTSARELGIAWFETSSELKVYLEKFPIKGSQILIKGSRGMRMETLIEVL